MIARTSRSIPWDIHEEHLDEAAFLWARWEDALVAAHYSLEDVAAGPEARLLAHLDALVLGAAPVAEELLLPALAAQDPGRVAAAAWGLVEAEHGDDYQDAVIDAMLKGEPHVRGPLARAFALSKRADLGRLARLWAGMPPQLRAEVLDLLGPRELAWARPRLEPSLRSGEATLMAAALRILRHEPEPAWSAHVEDALESEAPEVRGEAIATGVLLRSNAAWEACRIAATEPGDGCRLALGLLATSAHPEDRRVVRACVSDVAAKRHALWALGFAGDVEAADVLVEATEDESGARIAGESLSTITGLVPGRAMLKPGTTRGPHVREVGDDDPPPVVKSEDQLPLPDPSAVKRWWRRARVRFPQGVSHVQGRLRTPETLHAALATTSMWRREVMWLELARTTGSPPRVDLRAWTYDQRQQWAAR